MSKIFKDFIKVPVELMIELDSILSFVGYRGELTSELKEEMKNLSSKVRKLYEGDLK